MIKRLPNHIINQIAAGEVVERPASVIKELVENSIDAKATSIEIKIVDGGKSLISIRDNGIGISKDDLPLAIERHATSKLPEEDLFNINTFGFRGEALASISSIARIRIKSKKSDSENAYELKHENGVSEINLAVLNVGTIIEVTDLFYTTPARLKFLKSTNTESDACYNVFVNIALAYPSIAFKYVEDGRDKISLRSTSSLGERAKDLFGEEFAQNTKYIEKDSISGFIGVPNYNRATSSHQRFFINGRCIKDRQLSSIVKNAYNDVIPAGRYPVCVLFIDVPNEMIDVNVHPAKTEVRFRDIHNVTSSIYSFIKNNLHEGLSQQASSATARMGLNFSRISNAAVAIETPVVRDINIPRPVTASLNAYGSIMSIKSVNTNCIIPDLCHDIDEEPTSFFGKAIAQVDNAYIVSEKNGELLIIDQHAICERMLLEKLLNKEAIESQQLLIPSVITLEKSLVEIVTENIEFLERLGFIIERMSPETIAIRGIPAILGECDADALCRDVIDELSHCGTACAFENKIRMVYATMACHRSIRAGKSMTIVEMNALLEEAANTPNIAQCCHGRPSYVVLSSNDLKKIFER